jgi:hypothetical protein
VTRRASTDHIVILLDGSGDMRCEHCGVRRKLVLPARMKDMVFQTKAFIEGHRHCKPDQGTGSGSTGGGGSTTGSAV